MCFNGCELHRLACIHVLTHGMPTEEDQQTGNPTNNRSDHEGALEEIHVLFAEDVIATNSQNQERRHQHTIGDGMPEEQPTFGIAQECKEIHEFGAVIRFVDHISYWVLHPAIREQNPQGRKIRANGSEPNRGEMYFFRNTSLAKDPYAEERRFHKESEQCLHRQRGAKNIAHEAAVLTPVHTELEFLHDTCHNAEG